MTYFETVERATSIFGDILENWTDRPEARELVEAVRKVAANRADPESAIGADFIELEMLTEQILAVLPAAVGR